MKHYLYTHTRQDTNNIFYIGIGTKSKLDIRYNYFSRANSKYKRNTYWHNIVKLNPNYIIDIIEESDDYEYIKSREIELISFYGRHDLKKGTLANCTDGGDGNLCRIWTEESKKKLSDSKKGKPANFTKDYLEALRKRMLGNKYTLGYIPSIETREKLSRVAKGREPWNKGKTLSEKEINNIKKGIQATKKICKGCDFEFDSANYTRFHGDKCLIGSIKEFIPEIIIRFEKGHKILRIARDLNIRYRAVYKLKEVGILK